MRRYLHLRFTSKLDTSACNIRTPSLTRMESNRTHRQKKKREPQGVRCGGIALRQYIRTLRLKSKLFDLRVGYTNSFLLRKNVVLAIHTDKKHKDSHKGSPYIFGRSVEIRTPGLQYPNKYAIVF